MPTYDKHYLEPNYFGEPYPAFVAFFKKFTPKGKVLDLGCGQGRDSIALARMGYDVTGVDISEIGLSQMMKIAKFENLLIKGIVADIYTFDIDDSAEVVLLDSMLHFYKTDKERETCFLKRIMNELKVGGVLCVIIWKSKKIERELLRIVNNIGCHWETLSDKYIEYPEKKMEMRMIVIQKSEVSYTDET